MPIINRIADFQDDMTEWRRDFHAHPELGYEEVRTSAVITERLKAFGLDEVHTGLAGTGVVGVIRGSEPGEDAIGLRADIDALPIEEKTGVAYASTHPGKMHACGHDGHTTMLLGAARYLAETRRFAGTAYVIFQPAEEGGAGARKMVEDGLFGRFPMRAVFGMHNWPGMPIGEIAARVGPMMAAADVFAITITGRGGHGAMPHETRDPIVVAATLVQMLQTIVSRNVKALDNAVVSVTQIHAGDAHNVIPGTAQVGGTVRTFSREAQDLVKERMHAIAKGLEASFDVEIEVGYRHGYPVTANSEAETELALATAADVANRTGSDIEPAMGSEDFSFMLNERPGCYIWLGNGPSEGERKLHSAYYDFNDQVLPYGASYWARLVERALPAA
ncbi:M20 aminoacylase family protein [Marinivivus vitaminiproducens]|uniref:M20 aminoacylase family protein n=1 Tax=Marinivivus vitaminiproducens TaxID=3035935 RepID=UPI0027A81014|nr:M20 family metallopeptidase [Geminicoccaceae bacterium SCSIO 64248]